MNAEDHWETWKRSLLRGNAANADATEFVRRMCQPDPSREAVELAESNSLFRDALQRTMKSMLPTMLHYSGCSDLRRVMVAVFEFEWFEHVLLTERGTMGKSMAERARLVHRVTEMLCEHAGRQWVRDRAARWWRTGLFSEEESDSFVEILLARQVFRIEDFEHWGSTASDTAERVTQHAVPNGTLNWSLGDVANLQQIGNTSTPQWLRERTGLLLQTLSIPLDLKDSGLQKYELERLHKRDRRSVSDWPLFGRALETLFEMPLHHIRRRHPEFAAALIANTGIETRPSPFQTCMQLPLLRLMHMRLLLESPSLSDSLRAPGLLFVPDVIQYVMGRDYVSYAPELRVFGSSERRWRARWVETTAEAMAALTLEDSLRLDLTTLARIPEDREMTPDFLGVTETDERIVFETKGATSWKTHRSQRKEALAQLGKSKPSKPVRVEQPTWAGHGRSFAISLFAAKQGDDRASLLHVNDPIFAFDRLFDESWEDRSRRSHFAAVLEAAQLFDVAERLTRREAIQSDNVGGAGQTRFGLDDTVANDEGQQFVGSYLPIEDWARRIRHPDRHALKNLSVFVGVEARRFDDLDKGRLPSRCRSEERTSDSDAMPVRRIFSRTGLLPSREFPGQAKGIFSLLSNGSILALEVGP